MFISTWFIILFLGILILAFIRVARLSHRLKHCEHTVRKLEGLPPTSEELQSKTGD